MRPEPTACVAPCPARTPGGERPAAHSPPRVRLHRLLGAAGLLLLVSYACLQAQPPRSTESPAVEPAGKAADKQSEQQAEKLTPPNPGGSANPLPEGARKPAEVPAQTEEERVRLWTEGVSWFKSMEERGEIRSEQNDPNEHTAYCYTLSHAHQIPVEMLARNALRGVPFADLVKEETRKIYRFELVHFEGRLVQIHRIPRVPPKVRDVVPLKEYYEGWLFPRDDPNHQPICILFTELPPGMQVLERCNYWVDFEGYYFKLLEYRSEEKNEKGANIWRLAPLLIGHSPRLGERPDREGFSFDGVFVPMVAGTIVLIIAVAFGLSWWFRKGDREVRERLAGPKQNPFGDAPPESPGPRA